MCRALRAGAAAMDARLGDIGPGDNMLDGIGDEIAAGEVMLDDIAGDVRPEGTSSGDIAPDDTTPDETMSGETGVRAASDAVGVATASSPASGSDAWIKIGGRRVASVACTCIATGTPA